MELPHIGTHCAEPTCNKLDFLPFNCNLCKKEFCVDHHKYTTHNCTESYKADAQVPICPLCDRPVPSKRGEPPDLAVNEHMENNCKNKKKKIYTNKCSAGGCKTKEMIPVLCSSCNQNYCLRHRHPTDHECKGPAIVREQSLMAALSRFKSSNNSSSSSKRSQSGNSSNTQQGTRRVLSPASNPVQPTGHTRGGHAAKVSTLQGSMSEEEALARAMAASVLEVNGEPSHHTDAGNQQQEDEDTLLARTIAASLEENQRMTNREQHNNSNSCSVS